MSTEQKILRYCIEPKTTVDIADYCGLEKISIYTQLAKLQRNNKIEKRGDGRRGSPCVYVTIRQAPTATESSDNYENLVVKHAHNPFRITHGIA